MQSRARDIRFLVVVSVAVLALTVALVVVFLDEVNLSTRDSPLGHTIANITLVVGVAGALAPLLQVWRIVTTQSAEDVSLAFLGLYASTYVLGTATGVVLLMPAYYVPGTLGTTTSLTLVAVAARVRWVYRDWDELTALRTEDAAMGALVELDHTADHPATVMDREPLDAFDVDA